MKRLFATTLSALLLTGLLTACNRTSPVPDTAPDDPVSDFETGRAAILEANQDFLGGLTPEQMRADFDYLWALIRNDYPFLGVAERAGVDVDDIYSRYSENLPLITGDLDFMNYMAGMVREFGGRGHFELYNSAAYYTMLRDTYDSLRGMNPRFDYLAQLFENEASAKAYARLGAVEDEVMALYNDLMGAQAQAGETDEGAAQGEAPPTAEPTSQNVATENYDDFDTALLRIRSFGTEHIESDREVIANFFAENAGRGHIVIDIRGNGGGNDMYWREHLVEPNLREPVEAMSYVLYTVTDHNRDYMAASGHSEEGRPIAELPPLPELRADDRAAMDYFMSAGSVIEPSGGAPFTGKLWLLVDEGVYSSAETFSMFCKGVGFATVVGRPTSGDGGGVDPLPFVLPESGFIGRFSVFYSLNPDGSNSEEVGTIPDIVVDEDGDAFEACLSAIAAG